MAEFGANYSYSRPAPAAKGGVVGGPGNVATGSPTPTKADIDAIIGGGSAADTAASAERQKVEQIAAYYKAKGLPIPASTQAYLDKMGVGGGSSASASSGASASAGPPGTVTNTAAPNPVANTAIDEIMKRYQDKSTAGLDQGIRNLRANASMGISSEMAANRARMGSSGTSQDQVDARELAQGQEHAINGLTTDFVLGREKEKDNLIQAYGNMGLAQGAQQAGNVAQANNAWIAQQNLELQKKNDYLRSLQVVSSLLDRPSGIL